MAKLTGQEISDIGNSQEFLNRVAAVIKVKAQQWSTMETINRADVNRAMQKRKRLAATVMGNADALNARQVAAFWLGWYAWQKDPATLDQSSPIPLPSYDEIFNNFDPTWDQFSGVLTGDSTETEIQW